jgi:hypothetical protein
MASWIEAGTSRVACACGAQRRLRPAAAGCGRLRPAKGDGNVTATAPNPCVYRGFALLSIALSRRRPRVRVPSLPLRSRPQHALVPVPLSAKGRAVRCSSPFCLPNTASPCGVRHHFTPVAACHRPGLVRRPRACSRVARRRRSRRVRPQSSQGAPGRVRDGGALSRRPPGCPATPATRASGAGDS